MTTVYIVHSTGEIKKKKKKVPYCQCNNMTTYESRRTAKDNVNIHKDEILQKISPSYGLRVLSDRASKPVGCVSSFPFPGSGVPTMNHAFSYHRGSVQHRRPSPGTLSVWFGPSEVTVLSPLSSFHQLAFTAVGPSLILPLSAAAQSAAGT